MAEFALGVLENALDDVAFALQLLAGQPSKRSIKQAVRAMAAGTELLLKARLVREHWTLVLKEVDGAKKDAFDKGHDLQTCTFEQGISRLQDACGVRMDSKALRQMRQLRSVRNRMEHFRFSIAEQAAVAIVSQGASCAVDFIHDHLGEASLDVAELELLREIRVLLAKSAHVVEERWKTIKGAVASAAKVVQCPMCGQDAACVDSGVTCAFCRLSIDDAHEAALEYASEVLGLSVWSGHDAGDSPVVRCPECGCESLVLIRYDVRPSAWLCFNCANSWAFGELADCERCNELCHREDDGASICDDCKDWIRSDASG